MTTFNYKDIDINLTKSGDFEAQVGNKRVRKPSLDAMKKFIDKALREVFKPFDAVIEESHNRKGDEDGLLKVRVIGLSKTPQRRYSPWHWAFDIEGSSYPRERVMVNTPENRARYRALRQFIEETQRIEDERKARRAELERAVEYHVASEYAEGKAQ